jgi:hypothetical protein
MILIREILIPSFHSSYSLPDVSAGRIVRELWWTSQDLSPVGIIVTKAFQARIHPEDEK